MHRLLISIFIYISIISTAFANNSEELNQKIGLHLALNKLEWEKVIHISPECINCQNPEFTLIFNQKDSDKIFKSMLNKNLALPSSAKIYALLGLYISDDPEYKSYSRTFFKTPQKDVQTLKGKRIIEEDAKDYLYFILNEYSKEQIKKALIINDLSWNSNILNK